MKRERLSKEQASLEKKRRRTNLELLRLPTGAMRTMKEIAGAADLPVDRVFKDIVEAGLAVIRNPDSSPYESMIQFRRTLHERENTDREVSPRGDDHDSTQGIHGRPLGLRRDADQPVGNGEVAEEPDAEDTRETRSLGLGQREDQRSGDVDVEPGRSPETETGAGVPVGSVEDDEDIYDDRRVPDGPFDPLTGELR